jgi:hypothetical protein
MVATAELVLFGIQAAIRLAQAARGAYVQDTAMRGLVPPLPQGLDDPLTHAQQHARAVRNTDPQRYSTLFKDVDAQSRSSDPAVRRTAAGILLDLFLRDLGDGRVEGYAGNTQLSAGLYAVRQWQKGDEIYPHPLQRVGGALVEVAIDYFAHVPGILQTDTKHGKTILTLLQALDAADFQEADPDFLLVDMFKAAVQTASDHPELFTDNEARQQIIGSLLTGVAKESKAQLQAIRAQFGEGNFEKENDLARYGHIVLRTTLRQTSAEFLANPEVIGLHSEGHRVLVENVSATLMKFVFDETGDAGAFGFTPALRRTISAEGFSKLTLAALRGVSEHPEIFAGLGNKPVEAWLVHILRELYEGHAGDARVFDVDFLPDIAFLVIDHGLRDLPVLLNVDGQRPAFTVAVARAMFETIAFHEDGAVRWHFELSPTEVQSLFESAVAALSANAHWLSRNAEDQEKFAALLALGADVLGKAEPGLLKSLLRSNRLQPVLAALLSSGLQDKLTAESTERLVAVLRQTIQAARAEGVNGLGRFITDGALTDLMTAVGSDRVLSNLLGDDAQRVQGGITAVAALIDRLRKGEFISVPAMVKMLSAAVQGSP